MPRRCAPQRHRRKAITPALIAAATKEGELTWYTSADLQLAEKVGKSFEQKFPGIRVRVERAGGERIFARVAQEYASGLHIADAVSTGDAAQFLAWKRQGLLAPYVPEDVARHIPARASRSGWVLRHGALNALRDRLQHGAGEARGCAEKFCRPARSEMERQNRQGASELQRHYHDLDLSDGARASAGPISKNWRKQKVHADPVGDGHAEEDRARRALR